MDHHLKEMEHLIIIILGISSNNNIKRIWMNKEM